MGGWREGATRGEGGWEAGCVLRQPRLSEDGVVGGKDGGEECRQDEEKV